MYKNNTAVLLFLGLLLYTCFCGSGGVKKLHFKRISFEISENQTAVPLRFNKQTFSWNALGEKESSNILAKNITRGIGIDIKKHGSLRVNPGCQGTKGLQFTLYRYSAEKNLHINVYFKRKQRNLKKLSIIKENRRGYSHFIHEIFEFKAGDEIVIEARGQGAVIVSDLLIYDILPVSERKYVFLIALDNLGSGKIGGKRNGITLTPALNHFKQDSVFFENAFAQSSWTYPSFMSLFSGVNEHKISLRKYGHLPLDEPFLVEQMSEKFITVNFNGGAWMQPKFGNSRGFDYIQSLIGAEIPSSGEMLISQSVDFLQTHPVPRLMMFLHTYQVHSPFSPKAEYLKKINPSPKYYQLQNFADRYQYKSDVETEEQTALKELYDAEIMEFDHYFHRFIDYLKTAGIYDQSMIVFLSDHGEEFFEHSGWYHGHSLYNELVKVPLMIKFPEGAVTPQTLPFNVGLVDLFPTLLDFYDIPAPKNVDGTSLMKSIHTKKNPHREVHFSTSCCIFDHMPPKAGFVQKNHKIIFNFPFSEDCLNYFPDQHQPPPYTPLEIYDIEADPHEINNLTASRPDLIKQYRKKLNQVIECIQSKDSEKEQVQVDLTEKDIEKLRSLGYLK